MISDTDDRQLVYPVTPHAAPAPSVDSGHYEPGFVVPRLKGMHVGNDAQGRNAAFLAHAIARSPHNLRHHVQRMNLHTRACDGEALWGALIDLFLVLQSDGFALKQRMLAQSREVLGDDRSRFLQANIKQGLSNDGDLPLAIASVLHNGRRGTKRLVSQHGERSTAARDPLIDAHEHIEYGQVDEAQRILEEALGDDPQRVDLHHELLAIYRGKRDLDGLLKTQESFAADQNPVPDAWEEAAEFLRGNR